MKLLNLSAWQLWINCGSKTTVLLRKPDWFRVAKHLTWKI